MKMLLQIETIAVRQVDVKDQAAWGRETWACEEFLRGREDLRLPAGAADQPKAIRQAAVEISACARCFHGKMRS
jgi:hypothetical protein